MMEKETILEVMRGFGAFMNARVNPVATVPLEFGAWSKQDAQLTSARAANGGKIQNN